MQREPRFFSVRQLAQRHPGFNEASLRWAIFNAKAPPGTAAHDVYGGFAPAIIKIGRRVLIDEDRFVAWVEQFRPDRPSVR